MAFPAKIATEDCLLSGFALGPSALMRTTDENYGRFSPEKGKTDLI